MTGRWGRSLLLVATLAATLGLFGLLAATTSLRVALTAAGGIGLAFAVGLPLLELRRRAGPGEARFDLFPIPIVNVRGVLTVGGITAVAIGWLLVGGVLGTVLVMLLEDTSIDTIFVGPVALVAFFGPLLAGTLLTWEWFRRRMGSGR